MKKNELEPCPFCGENPELIGGSFYWVRCSNFKCKVYPSTSLKKGKEKAIKEWNRHMTKVKHGNSGLSK
jgi:hypothetical protein